MQSTSSDRNLSITARNHNSGPWRLSLLLVPNAVLSKRTRPHVSRLTSGCSQGGGQERGRGVRGGGGGRYLTCKCVNVKFFPFHLQRLPCHFPSAAPGVRMRLSFKSFLNIFNAQQRQAVRKGGRKKKKDDDKKQKQEMEPRKET